MKCEKIYQEADLAIVNYFYSEFATACSVLEYPTRALLLEFVVISYFKQTQLFGVDSDTADKVSCLVWPLSLSWTFCWIQV